ncbi:MAG: response regulator [Desulfovibrionaceae bacterium]
MLKIRVLLVDDDYRFRTDLAKTLEDQGFEVMTASRVSEALALRDAEPDVVVCDLQMPEKNGDELMEAFRSRPTTQIIVLTSHGSVSKAVEASWIGAFDYLTKPCDVKFLISRIKDAYKTSTTGWHAEIHAEDLMIPLSQYTTIRSDQSVLEAIQSLREHNERIIPQDLVSDKGHRSIIVMDPTNHEAIGYVTIRDLVGGLYKAHLAAQPSSKETTRFSRFFWDGVFTRQVEDLLNVPISQVMSAHTLRVNVQATLMEVAEMMFAHNLPRLLVEDEGKVVGIIRDQELYQEIDRIAKQA